jgi:hypothetical protein
MTTSDVRQFQTLQHCAEPRIGTQILETRIHAQPGDYSLATVKSLPVPFQCRVHVTQSVVQAGKGDWADILPCRQLFQFPKDSLGLVPPACFRPGVGNGISLVWLHDLTDEEFGLQPFFHVTPINAVMYDPATNTAYAEPNEILAQHCRYLR